MKFANTAQLRWQLSVNNCSKSLFGKAIAAIFKGIICELCDNFGCTKVRERMQQSKVCEIWQHIYTEVGQQRNEIWQLRLSTRVL